MYCSPNAKENTRMEIKITLNSKKVKQKTFHQSTSIKINNIAHWHVSEHALRVELSSMVQSQIKQAT